MTTKSLPRSQLKAQADKIAKALKNPLTPQMRAARQKPNFKAGIVMDDKVLTLEMPWSLVDSTEEAALSEYIVGLMQETRAIAH